MAKVPAVLVVDENDDSRVELSKLLTRGGLTVAGEARYGASAATAANELRPDAILVGIEEPPNRALETIETLSQLMLDTPILAYSSLDEPDAMRRATRAGVRDYLSRPLAAVGLREAIIAALEQEDRRRLLRAGQASASVHGSVITVTGAKGGVGKSVVAINLAIALRQVTGRTVALVDCDTHFGDVAMMLNVRPESTVTNAIATVASLDRSTVREQTLEHPSGIRILPGPPEPEEWEGITPEDAGRLVGLLAEAFDFVVIDTPDVFDRIVERCVHDSTLALLVTNMDLSSIADTRVALRLLHRWNCPPEKVRLMVNNNRRQKGLGDKNVRVALSWPVFCTIPYEKRVPEAAQLGESLLLTAPKSFFSRGFRELAGAISGAGTSRVKSEQPKKRRLFRRLRATAAVE